MFLFLTLLVFAPEDLSYLSFHHVFPAGSAHGKTLFVGLNRDHRPFLPKLVVYDYATHQAEEDNDDRIRVMPFTAACPTKDGFFLFVPDGTIYVLDKRGLFVRALRIREFSGFESGWQFHQIYPGPDQSFWVNAQDQVTKDRRFFRVDPVAGVVDTVVSAQKVESYLPLNDGFLFWDRYTGEIGTADSSFEQEGTLVLGKKVVKYKHPRYQPKYGSGLQIRLSYAYPTAGLGVFLQRFSVSGNSPEATRVALYIAKDRKPFQDTLYLIGTHGEKGLFFHLDDLEFAVRDFDKWRGTR